MEWKSFVLVVFCTYPRSFFGGVRDFTASLFQRKVGEASRLVREEGLLVAAMRGERARGK